jgi:hypothetical protein
VTEITDAINHKLELPEGIMMTREIMWTAMMMMMMMMMTMMKKTVFAQ